MPDQSIELIPKESAPKHLWYKHPWLWIIIGFLVIWFGSPLVINIFWGNNNFENNFTNISNKTTAPTADNSMVTSDDPSQGSLLAPVTIVEFSDFQCPYCREAAPIIKQVLKQYPEAVRFIFRDFPIISIHSEAVPSAVAANCAMEQGKFWEYHDALFSQQEALGPDLYLTLARSFALDEGKFKNCLNSPLIIDEIENDFEAGLAAGVGGTPTFFVNGQIVEGSLPYDYWVKIIAAEVSKKFKK
ncbi:MAG: DsbA family protein [Patescibacteria group bacterium]